MCSGVWCFNAFFVDQEKGAVPHLSGVFFFFFLILVGTLLTLLRTIFCGVCILPSKTSSDWIGWDSEIFGSNHFMWLGCLAGS